MSNLKIFIVNGKGGVGKDTLEKMVIDIAAENNPRRMSHEEVFDSIREKLNAK